MNKNSDWSLQNKLFVIAFLLLIGLSVILNYSHKTENLTEKKYVSADTLIPAGHVLIPLDIANIEAVAALIDQYGVIDLYAGSSAEDSQQIARQVKILRAPLNPNQYAVLVTESLAKEIMKYKKPFWAAVQNRLNAAPTQALAEAPKPSKVVTQTVLEIEYHKSEAP